MLIPNVRLILHPPHWLIPCSRERPHPVFKARIENLVLEVGDLETILGNRTLRVLDHVFQIVSWDPAIGHLFLLGGMQSATKPYIDGLLAIGWTEYDEKVLGFYGLPRESDPAPPPVTPWGEPMTEKVLLPPPPTDPAAAETAEVPLPPP